MSFAEVDRKLADLDIPDNWNEGLLPDEKVHYVRRFHGETWDSVHEDFRSGLIDQEMFTGALLVMIDEYARHRFREKLEKKLADLRRAV